MRTSVLKMKSRQRAPSPVRVPKAENFPIVGIGASAGGLEAFSDLVANLPAKTGMGFVLVQHLDPTHSSELRDILARKTSLPVVNVTDGVVVLPDHIFVIPPNKDMAIRKSTLRLSERMLTRGLHLPIDHFLRSLAEDRGPLAISVILSGTASDGTEGSRAVKAAGGITFAQDERSAKYGSMPHSAVSAGCVDFVVPPAAIARELSRIGKHPYLAPSAGKESEDGLAPGQELNALLSLVDKVTGVDFTHYKHTTLQRRIKRRMVVNKVETLQDYLRFVRDNPGEVEDLYQDILIHVTGFFRDPETFDALRKHVFPHLFQDGKDRGTIRIWVPGCSTGEEAYSLAMALLEYIWLHTQKTARATLGNIPFQIFATDISETSLARARAGFYSEASVAEISPARLKRFFLPLDGGYQITKSVREMCIFAKQNVAKDPPFSNLDLISCRNLLIYLGPVLQERVLPTLHYALKPTGYLMLGESESLGNFSDCFVPVDRKSKIFQKRKTAGPLLTYFSTRDHRVRVEEPKLASEPQTASTVEKEADRVLFHRFVPASIVTNEDMEIVQFRGKTGAYLEPVTGRPTFSLLKMVIEGLRLDLRAAFSKAKKERTAVRKEGVTIQSNGGTREVNLEVIPVSQQGKTQRFYVVIFQDVPVVAPQRGSGGRKESGKTKDTRSRELGRLKSELGQMREQFQLLLEDHETTTEEFKAGNEEILSANEELQSTNEELGTAKEELQSTNEELTTLNEELHNRNAELGTANSDLLNLFNNVSISVVMVGMDLHIRHFTPTAQKLLNLLPGDVGRRVSDIRPNVEAPDLGQMALEAIESVSSRELEVSTKEGRRYLLHVRPYKTWDGRIDGAVISFQDVDAILVRHRLDLAHLFARELIENAREAIVILDGALKVLSGNLAFYRVFGVHREETEGRSLYELGNEQWNIPRLRELLEKVLPENGRVEDFEVRHEFPGLGERAMLLNARRIEPQAGEQLILLYIEDVTNKM
jgi:two-component system, chemotaxis family, CheB/CheR fusion protein